MRKIQLVLAIPLITSLLMLTVGPAGAQTEQSGLDAGFGTGGVARFAIPDHDLLPLAQATQRDGKIVVASRDNKNYSPPPTGFSIRVTRFNANGTLDTTFGTAGSVRTTVAGPYGPTSTDVTPYAITVDHRNRTVVVGSADTYLGPEVIAVVRFTPSGSPDPSFGNNGVVLTSLAGYQDYATDVVAQGDDRLVVAAASNELVNLQPPRAVLLRYNLDGTLDASFHPPRYVSGAEGFTPMKVAMMPGGRVVTASARSYFYLPSQVSLILHRYLPSGAADPTFGTNGKADLVLPSSADTIGDLTVGVDGSAVVTGKMSHAYEDTAYVAKVTPSGVLDPTFGIAGVTEISMPMSLEGIGAARDRLGRVLVWFRVPPPRFGKVFGVARLTSAGQLDPTFGTGGIARPPAELEQTAFVTTGGLQCEAATLTGFPVSPGQNGSVMVTRFRNGPLYQPASPFLTICPNVDDVINGSIGS
ncbi:MAG TPA: hypothetical protein VM121_11365 [Acidimicrobiales bacterium]|nr:hypothetical protein [Acidimicrobiales bacterium]